MILDILVSRTNFSNENNWSAGDLVFVKSMAILSTGTVDSKSMVNLPYRYYMPIRFVSKHSSPVSMS